MYAVVETGGKQYTVKEGDTIRVEKIQGAPGEEVLLDKVLLVGGGEEVRVGNPFIDDAKIRAEIMTQQRSRKIIVFKFKRRKNVRKKQGHRQHFTGIRIKAIETA